MSFFVPVLVAKLFAVGAGFLTNFLLSYFVVFRKSKETSNEQRRRKVRDNVGENFLSGTEAQINIRLCGIFAFGLCAGYVSDLILLSLCIVLASYWFACLADKV